MTDKVYIPGPVERCRATDVTRDGAVGRDFVDPMASILERQCRRYGNVRMRDRKPRYDRAVSVGRTWHCLFREKPCDPVRQTAVKNHLFERNSTTTTPLSDAIPTTVNELFCGVGRWAPTSSTSPTLRPSSPSKIRSWCSPSTTVATVLLAVDATRAATADETAAGAATPPKLGAWLGKNLPRASPRGLERRKKRAGGGPEEKKSRCCRSGSRTGICFP